MLFVFVCVVCTFVPFVVVLCVVVFVVVESVVAKWTGPRVVWCPVTEVVVVVVSVVSVVLSVLVVLYVWLFGSVVRFSVEFQLLFCSWITCEVSGSLASFLYLKLMQFTMDCPAI